MTAFHVLLTPVHEGETTDLTPDSELSYVDARVTMLAFARLFPILHEAGAPSFLEIVPVRGER
jgi:hypothetical protein